MIEVTEFKSIIVTPLLDTFKAEPGSLSKAFSIIWAVDSYASHVHFALRLDKDEAKFKDRLQEQCWQFRIIREASNATKHAVRRQPKSDVDEIKFDVGKSDDVVVPKGGWHAFLNRAQSSVTIQHNWKWNKHESHFIDGRSKPVNGPSGLNKTVYLIRMLDPAIEVIDRAYADSCAEKNV